MSDYNVEKDVVLKEIGSVPAGEKGNLVVRVRSYDGKGPSISIEFHGKRASGEAYSVPAKPRFQIEQLGKLLPLLTKASKFKAAAVKAAPKAEAAVPAA